jgi:hypothetical protein
MRTAELSFFAPVRVSSRVRRCANVRHSRVCWRDGSWLPGSGFARRYVVSQGVH